MPTPADTITVPGHWVLQGDGNYGHPIYTNIQFPFPLDPPNVPDENPTADYRRTFDLPDDWPSDGQIWLRFDGIESLAKVWLNGREVGVIQGSRLRQELDVTDIVRAGDNVLDVRVGKSPAQAQPPGCRMGLPRLEPNESVPSLKRMRRAAHGLGGYAGAVAIAGNAVGVAAAAVQENSVTFSSPQ